MAIRFLAPLLLAIVVAPRAFPADTVDPGLLAEIRRIRAIDDHTHDDPVDAARGRLWRVDLPLGTSPYPDVLPLRRDNPEWNRAWRALYGYKYFDTSFAPPGGAARG